MVDEHPAVDPLREKAEAVAFTQVKAPDWLPVDRAALDDLREFLASPAVPRPEGLDVEALATALERTYHGSHPSSARRDDWVSDASFVADEYAAIILARLSDTGDTP